MKKSTRPRAVIILIGVALVAAVVTGSAALRTKAGPHAARPADDSTSVATAGEGRGEEGESVPSPADRQGPLWRRGTRRVYATVFSSDVQPDTTNPKGRFSLEGAGKLSLTAEQVDAGRVTLQVGFSEPTLVLGNEEHEGKRIEDTIAADLARPFVVTLAPNGAIDSVAADRDTAPFTDAILRMLVAATQVARPPGAAAGVLPPEWTADESDQSGKYRARYATTGPGQLRKTKLAYTYFQMAQVVTTARGGATPRVTGEATLALTEQGALQHVQADETVEVPLDKSSSKAISHLTLDLVETTEVEVAALDRTRLKPVMLYDTRARNPSEAEKLAAKQKLAGDATVAELAGKLAALPATKENFEARWAVVRQMTALFDTKPAAIADALARLRNADRLPPADADMLLGALSDATTPAAQAALAKLAEDPNADRRLRDAATAHLGLEEKPTAATFESLKRMALAEEPDARATATLALGGAARHAGTDDETSQAAQGVVRELARSADSASTPDERRLYLGALGNAGSADGLDAIRKGLTDASASIRAASVQALRFVSTDEAEQLVIKAWLEDSDASVRAAAALAAGYRPWTTAIEDACGRSLRVEPDGRVRMNVVQVLVAKLQQAPGPATLLAWAAANDASPDIRNAANRALHPELAARR